MDVTVLVALITALGSIITTLIGKNAYDRIMERGRSGNTRSEIEFQTRMTLFLEQSMKQMEAITQSLNAAALAIRDVHTEIAEHRLRAEEALPAVMETHMLVKRGTNVIRGGNGT